ncbi:MAG: hypothetical protein WBF99_12580 [Xanthobacteraceae bacterium]
MVDLSDLIARVEAASGGDRELDHAIHYHLVVVKSDRFTERSWTTQAKAENWNTPRYSSSIDAALTLLPEGIELDLKLRKDGTGYACAWTHHGNRSSTGAALTLATLSAILKARQASTTAQQSEAQSNDQ